jgi:hypothetical protein
VHPFVSAIHRLDFRGFDLWKATEISTRCEQLLRPHLAHSCISGGEWRETPGISRSFS